MTISVVTWRWRSQPGYRSTFGPESVNTLYSMVKRHFAHPFRFICVTDDAQGLDYGIEVRFSWDDFAAVPSPHGARYPSCYRRLRLFHPGAARWFGERFVSLDLDLVITADVTALWTRSEDFVAWRDPNPPAAYNGSMLLLRAGARPNVWRDFHPVASPRLAAQHGFRGSDQAWISACLGPNEAVWTKDDGVFSYRMDIAKQKNILPPSARVVVFHGKHDPWDACSQEIDWVRAHYR